MSPDQLILIEVGHACWRAGKRPDAEKLLGLGKAALDVAEDQ